MKCIIVKWAETTKKNRQKHLKKLNSDLKEKIQEIKVKMNYERTKDLIEKYDEKPKHPPNATHNRNQQNLRNRNPQNGAFNANSPSKSPAGLNQRPVAMTKKASWYDKLADAIVGIEPGKEYALICNFCYNHNGLITLEQVNKIQYICPNCKKFNPAKDKSVSAGNENLKEASPKANLEELEKNDKVENEKLENIKEEKLSDDSQEKTVSSKV